MKPCFITDKHWSHLKRCILIFSIVCIFSVWSPPAHAAEPQAHTQVTRIIPTIIDSQNVYPSTYATIALDPLQVYHWQELTLPSSWVGAGYYFEIWDSENQIVPGFIATKLETATIDLHTIDVTRYPQIRLILFQPETVPLLSADIGGVYFVYSQQSNTRLYIFFIAILCMYLAAFGGLLYQRIRLRELFTETKQLLIQTPGQDQHSPTLRQATLSMLVIIFWSSIFGAILGGYNGGAQIIYLLIKLPFLFLCAFAFTITSNAILSSLLGVRASLQALCMQALRVIATTSLVLAAFAPIVIFYITTRFTHDQLLLWVLVFFGAACAIGAARFLQWLWQKEGSAKTLLVFGVWVVLYGVVLLQLGWLLRPWVGIVDPVQQTIPFSRLYGGNVFIELLNTFHRLSTK
ncbi:MAG: hypothetical protein HYV32_03785 [Candidatus Kerfeldbacteria bacterium]|nr:hypothetical protein [Candidatus Kerfeldbacteria bacterium]